LYRQAIGSSHFNLLIVYFLTLFGYQYFKQMSYNPHYRHLGQSLSNLLTAIGLATAISAGVSYQVYLDQKRAAKAEPQMV
jgi:hypothetical protein